jgi:hypothetical protein
MKRTGGTAEDSPLPHPYRTTGRKKMNNDGLFIVVMAIMVFMLVIGLASLAMHG